MCVDVTGSQADHVSTVRDLLDARDLLSRRNPNLRILPLVLVTNLCRVLTAPANMPKSVTDRIHGNGSFIPAIVDGRWEAVVRLRGIAFKIRRRSAATHMIGNGQSFLFAFDISDFKFQLKRHYLAARSSLTVGGKLDEWNATMCFCRLSRSF